MTLDELERLGREATPAPWTDEGHCVIEGGNDERSMIIYGGYDERDTAFIVAARNNWQAMIDELRQFRDVARQIVKQHDRGTLSPLPGDSVDVEKLRKLIGLRDDPKEADAKELIMAVVRAIKVELMQYNQTYESRVPAEFVEVTEHPMVGKSVTVQGGRIISEEA